MPIPLVVTKRYEGQRVTSWWQPATQTKGIQIATESYAALQAMAPTNIKTIHQTSLLHKATSIDSECCRPPTTNVLSKKPEKLRKNYAPTSFDQQVQDSQGHTLYRNKKKWNTEVQCEKLLIGKKRQVRSDFSLKMYWLSTYYVSKKAANCIPGIKYADNLQVVV